LARQHTLGAGERLKSRKQLENLFEKGSRLSVAPLRVIYIKTENADFSTRFGVGVSSRLFKKAVDRNRVKRLLRECWRLQKLPLQKICENKKSGLQVFVIYTSREMPRYSEIFPRMQKLVSLLQSEMEKN